VPGYSSKNLTCEDVFAHAEQIFDPTDFRILKSSLEQYDKVLPQS
jgi:hypothetical protein